MHAGKTLVIGHVVNFWAWKEHWKRSTDKNIDFFPPHTHTHFSGSSFKLKELMENWWQVQLWSEVYIKSTWTWMTTTGYYKLKMQFITVISVFLHVLGICLYKWTHTDAGTMSGSTEGHGQHNTHQPWEAGQRFGGVWRLCGATNQAAWLAQRLNHWRSLLSVKASRLVWLKMHTTVVL